MNAKQKAKLEAIPCTYGVAELDEQTTIVPLTQATGGKRNRTPYFLMRIVLGSLRFSSAVRFSRDRMSALYQLGQSH
jgi:hypothetical protein